ncbi:hypothetical protein [Micromonospora sp. NBC_00421]|uniref:hypothetical protein n=1 Tax=Micromonospora sp. NBC_00421 TaxID=2975976 RepID=UPI002E220FC6
MTYLISAAVPGVPLVGVHVAGRAGNAWAELSLPQATELAEQLRGLLTEATERDDAGQDHAEQDGAGQDRAGQQGSGDE